MSQENHSLANFYETIGTGKINEWKYNEAEIFLKKALTLTDTTQNFAKPKTLILLKLASSIELQGRLEEALRYYENILEHMLNDRALDLIDKAEIYLTIGQYHYYAGNSEKAKKFYQQALNLQKKDKLEIVFMKAIHLLKEHKDIEATPDYISSIIRSDNTGAKKEGEIARWHDKTNKLFIYIPDECPATQSICDELSETYKAAFQAWGAVLNNRFNYKYVDTDKQYDTRIYWREKSPKAIVYPFKHSPMWLVDTSGYGGKIGQNKTAFAGKDGHSYIMNDIEMFFHDSENRPYPLNVLKSAILHEVGHAMGIKGHSPNPTDIMYEGLPFGFKRMRISSRDAETLRKIYEHKPTYANDPQTHVSYYYHQYKKKYRDIETMAY
ncbi:MAG: tetratricopeptide repeat protein [Vampirovibrio sp.]|nr:tetratricopeptide repeat protein [Vampirovibrio sp.]